MIDKTTTDSATIDQAPNQRKPRTPQTPAQRLQKMQDGLGPIALHFVRAGNTAALTSVSEAVQALNRVQAELDGDAAQS